MTVRPVPRQAALIVNAHSRRGRDLFREAKTRLEESGIELLESHAVKDPRNLNATVDRAVANGAPMVIIGGGDGSLSCTIDFVVGRDCVFALLPLGTANSFARTLGIPLDLEGAVRTIATGRRRRIDLGTIDGDYFANCAAMGLSPMIGEGIPHKLKRYLGRVGYLAWATWCLIKFRPFKLSIDNGEEKRTVWATEVRIANGRFHGGVELVEHTDVDSGELVVQAVTGRSKLALVWNWVASLLKLPARQAPVEHFHGQVLRIDTKPRQKISIDGEVLAKTPTVAELAHCAVEVVVPAE
ncbi:diacylglycerol kinase [Sphingomonas parva]|uniref:Diacylglycerol kinase n=1 Tax=Sphingomonas parva TaxID=2555898 RepID=A0A4Y8ZTJ6_9SPHN|nr:diacylglycerol kinase family protein [Sphingomonas parva]TFI59234.1 diacylglycerol kinase [Sphingomonas parva]